MLSLSSWQKKYLCQNIITAVINHRLTVSTVVFLCNVPFLFKEIKVGAMLKRITNFTTYGFDLIILV